MKQTVERRYKGRIIGHTVKFLPKRVEQLGPGITVTKAGKIGAFVTIQVDDQKIYTVPSKGNEIILGNEDPSPEARAAVYDMLVSLHPFDATRRFSEFVVPRAKGKLRRYELDE